MMRFWLIFFALVLSKAVVGQHESIGIRVGAPTGLSYKKYISNSTTAIEVGLGGIPQGAQQKYYQNSFNKDNSFKNDTYVDHSVDNSVFFQLRVLKQYPLHIEDVEGDFEWYWGVGALMKVAKVDYWYTEPGTPGIQQSKNSTDFDLGPEIPLGIEYTFEDVPLTLFGEVSLFLEIVDRPGAAALYGGVGLRYNFFGGKL